MKNKEYLQEQKESIFNDTQWATYKANFNQAHASDKNKVSFTNNVNNLVYAMLDTERVTNKNIDDLIDLASYLLRGDKFVKFKELTSNGFDFKVAVVEIITSTKKVGVVSTREGDTKSQKIGLKVARGERILRDLFLTLLSEEYITKIEKKEKAKKTTSKK